MSIIRVGLAETKKFSEGYEAIFGKKKKSTDTKSTRAPKKCQGTTKKKTCKKK